MTKHVDVVSNRLRMHSHAHSLCMMSVCAIMSLGCARGLPLPFTKANPPLQKATSQSSDQASSEATARIASRDSSGIAGMASASNAQAEPRRGEHSSAGPLTAKQLAPTTDPALATQSAQPQNAAIAVPTSMDVASIPPSQSSSPVLYDIPALDPTAQSTNSVAAESNTASLVSPVGFQSPQVPQQAASQPFVHIAVKNVQPFLGKLRIAVFTNSAAFPNSASKGLTAVLAADAASMSTTIPLNENAIEQAKQKGNSSVAVAVYQDINGDGQLNRNRQGIPLEPCAFSRAAMGRRGPPTFEEAAVPLNLSSGSYAASIEITLPGGKEVSGGE